MTNQQLTMARNSLLRKQCRLVQLTLACCLVATLGCGDGRPGRVPVSGQVLIDGKPLEKASVRLIPVEGRSSLGQTDDQGRFTLTCYEKNDGATLGKHRVSVVALTYLDNDRVLSRVPKKYHKASTSEIEVDIQEARDDLEINLTWDGGKPFVIQDE